MSGTYLGALQTFLLNLSEHPTFDSSVINFLSTIIESLYYVSVTC